MIKQATNPFLNFTQQRSLLTPRGEVLVEGPIPSARLRTMSLDPGLKAFRPPEKQHQALLEIASLPVGAVTVARQGNLIIGYATFHPPDEYLRWGQAHLPFLLEMGAIEVSPPWRQLGIGRAILEVAFANPVLEDYIVIVNEFYWHWDLKTTGLSVWSYRQMLERVMSTVGLIRCDTDEPEIASHPANMFMVRIGSHITQEQMEAFERLRYQNRWLF